MGILRFNNAAERISKSEYLPNFYSMGESDFPSFSYAIQEVETLTNKISKAKKGAKVKTPKPKPELTPKNVYQMKMLNDESFIMKADPKYVDAQLEDFKEKLGMLKSTEWDMDRGTTEISSVIARFENRKKYAEHKAFYDEFPYTSTKRMNELVKEHNYLQIGEVSQFLADMPKEATDVMKRYTAETKKLCDKKPLFYIIANKKDFKKTEKRRDPILLAQSPFGHFWQILGAWDEEMLLIEEL